MTVKIGFVGYLDVRGIRNNSEIELAENTSIEDVLARCGIKPQHRGYIVPYVNGEKQMLSYPLQDEDSLYLFLPVGGGRPSAQPAANGRYYGAPHY